MITFIQLPYRRVQTAAPHIEVGPRATAIVLALILCFQIGLLIWVFFGTWRG